jgi:hypothetical protein
MKKSVIIMFHLFFWIFSSLLIILGFNLLALPAMVLGGGGGLGIGKQLSALLIALPFGAIIFYPSYFSLNFFVKRTSRFIWLALGYVILFSGMLFF